MVSLTLARIVDGGSYLDAILREGDFVIGDSSTVNLLASGGSGSATFRGLRPATLEELNNCRAGHVRFHYFRGFGLTDFVHDLVSKDRVKELIKGYGISNLNRCIHF